MVTDEAAVGSGKVAQARGEPRRELAGQQPPLPVPPGRRGQVHAGLVAQAEEILHGDDCGVCRRRQREADEVPVNLAPGRAEVPQDTPVRCERPSTARAAVVTPQTLKPAHRGVVVVRAGVDDAVRRKRVRLVVAVAFTVERGLQDAHAREAEAFAERDGLRRHHAEVLGDDLLRAEAPAQGGQQLAAGDPHPPAVLRGAGAAGHGPDPIEAEEMVDTDRVEQREQPREAGEPPREPGRLVLRPAVLRVAPKLAGLAEHVRRTAGLRLRSSGGVEVEEARVGPDVAAIVRDEEGAVADEPDAAVVGVAA